MILGEAAIFSPLRLFWLGFYSLFFAGVYYLTDGCCLVSQLFSRRRARLMQIIDQHCSIENEDENIKSGGGVKSEYDFIYLPMDFRYYPPPCCSCTQLRVLLVIQPDLTACCMVPRTGANKGYAFVNLTTPEAARRLYKHLHDHRWMVNRSGKTCEVDHGAIEVVRRPLPPALRMRRPVLGFISFCSAHGTETETSGTGQPGESLLGLALPLRRRGVSPCVVRAGPRRHPDDGGASRRPHARLPLSDTVSMLSAAGCLILHSIGSYGFIGGSDRMGDRMCPRLRLLPSLEFVFCVFL